MFPHFERQLEQKRRALLRAHHIICVSESTRRDLLELYEVEPERVSVVLLGSSIETAAGPPREVDFPYFLHVGARWEYKNFGRLLQAFGETRLYRTHRLVSFCERPFSAEELAMIKAAGIPEGCVLSASGDDEVLARYYAGAEALVFPSLYEGFGIPLVEAMCCGCPIIASNVSSLPEIAGDAAIYFDPKDVTSIEKALLSVVSSRETRTALIDRGRARARRFSWERCAAETYAVYKALADR